MAYALGFLSCDDISARCMLSIFQFFATKTDASRLRMLNGSPAERLLAPIADYITSKRVPCDLGDTRAERARMSQSVVCCFSSVSFGYHKYGTVDDIINRIALVSDEQCQDTDVVAVVAQGRADTHAVGLQGDPVRGAAGRQHRGDGLAVDASGEGAHREG